MEEIIYEIRNAFLDGFKKAVLSSPRGTAPLPALPPAHTPVCRCLSPTSVLSARVDRQRNTSETNRHPVADLNEPRWTTFSLPLGLFQKMNGLPKAGVCIENNSAVVCSVTFHLCFYCELLTEKS